MVRRTFGVARILQRFSRHPLKPPPVKYLRREESFRMRKHRGQVIAVASRRFTHELYELPSLARDLAAVVA